MGEKDFYVGIYEPQDVRRNVLESSREIISSIQSKRGLDAVRHAKLTEYENIATGRELGAAGGGY